ncbi:hypothetical protein C8R45DRAFT_207148 [Mycena sanguinolenta]|nr:hypothetical protein C8R45DRAFT_207148 [Mycena sanguinolenta]
MSPIASPAVNQQAFFFSSLIPAGLLLALLTLSMKRRRQLSPSPTDPEAQRMPIWHDPCNGPIFEKVPRSSPSVIKEELPISETPVKVPHAHKRFQLRQKGRLPITKRMRRMARKNREVHDRLHFEHMKNNLSCWGTSWLGRGSSSAAASLQDETPVATAYPAAPPPAFR